MAQPFTSSISPRISYRFAPMLSLFSPLLDALLLRVDFISRVGPFPDCVPLVYIFLILVPSDTLCASLFLITFLAPCKLPPTAGIFPPLTPGNGFWTFKNLTSCGPFLHQTSKPHGLVIVVFYLPPVCECLTATT